MKLVHFLQEFYNESLFTHVYGETQVQYKRFNKNT